VFSENVDISHFQKTQYSMKLIFQRELDVIKIRRYDDNFGFVLILLPIIIIVLVVMMNVSDNDHRSDINNKIQSIQGEVISVDEKSIFSDQPFHWANPKGGDRIYKITYKVNSEEKTGWVIFRAFSTDWEFKSTSN